MPKPPDLEDIKVDLEMPDSIAYSSPPRSPFNKGTFRRLRRILKGFNRRLLLVLSVFTLLVFVTYSSTKNIVAYTPWISSGAFECPSNRSSPHNVSPPPLRDTAPLAQQWNRLRTLFDEHPPTPSYIPHPKHDEVPTKKQTKELVNITEAQAYQTRIEHETVIRHIPPYPENMFEGRGIVMLAGGKYSEFAATALGMLREVGSQLPVEVWIKDRSEETPGWCEELEQEGMACRRLQDYMDMSILPMPYQWKVFTILFSSFKEIIFLDADDMPIRNPDVIFDSAVYRENGAILWPDYWKHTGSWWLPYIVGVKDEASDMWQDEKSAESGQLVWNKEWHWKSLVLATYYNYHGPSYYFTLLNSGWAGWGDKDTFPIALKALDEPYHQVTYDIITVFVTGTVLGIGMVQADPTNVTSHQTMFLHSNIVKWSMRDFLCLGCTPLNGDGTFVGHMEKSSSPVQKHLVEGKRIFSKDQLEDIGLDPEPLIWRVLEHTACRSAAWGNRQVCEQARAHMVRVFGYRFEASRWARFLGYGDRICPILD